MNLGQLLSCLWWTDNVSASKKMVGRGVYTDRNQPWSKFLILDTRRSFMAHAVDWNGIMPLRSTGCRPPKILMSQEQGGTGVAQWWQRPTNVAQVRFPANADVFPAVVSLDRRKYVCVRWYVICVLSLFLVLCLLREVFLWLLPAKFQFDLEWTNTWKSSWALWKCSMGKEITFIHSFTPRSGTHQKQLTREPISYCNTSR